jgi:hypothetical protein
MQKTLFPQGSVAIILVDRSKSNVHGEQSKILTNHLTKNEENGDTNYGNP